MSTNRYLYIYLDLFTHFTLTALLSLFIFIKTHSISYVFFVVLGGVLIDMDHFIDHIVYFKKKINFFSFMRSDQLRSGKVYLIFHSWELICIILIMSLTFNSAALWALFLGASAHLIVDNIQRKNPLFYFLLYRCYKKFEVKTLLPEYA